MSVTEQPTSSSMSRQFAAGEGSGRLAAVPVVVAVLVGAAVGHNPSLAVFGVLLTVLAVVVLRPVTAAYLWLGLTPLVVGIDRGNLVPLLRPNEALLLLLVVGLFAGWLVRWVRGRQRRLTITPVELGFVLLALAGAVLPLLWTVAQQRQLGLAEVLSAANVVKYFLVYLVVRLAVSTEQHIRRCLWVSLLSGAIVAVLAVMQALQLFGVAELLATWWTPFGGSNRGSSTIGQAQGLADVMVLNLSIATAMVLRGGASRWLLAAAALFLVGALASGQVSGLVALVVGVLAIGYALGQLRRVLPTFLASAPVAAVLLVPVIAARLATVDPRSGVPISWEGRWYNLNTYFWPRLFDDGAWLLGVQLVAEAEGKESWQPVVWIESGHTWLLWIGGVPFLVAFLVFVWLSLRLSLQVARTATGAGAVAGAASFAAWWVITIGMTFDPHLFLRGSADLSFPLLALAVVGAEISRRPS